MKRLILTTFLICCTFFVFGQVVPSFNMGIKGGLNLSKFSIDNTFASDSKSGFYGGIWTRFGVAGIHLQPELYFSEKNTELKNNLGQQNKIKFSSLDLPILLGTKIGAAGVGVRLNTGPVVSFILDKEQSFDEAAAKIFSLDLKDQALGWQFGTGLDLGKLSVDLRYEMGLSKLNSDGDPETKLNLFTLGLGIKLF
ncbi:porin family protein [Pedobacter sp. UBA4863]|uniref:porin family protein n=1 Tax=Pedobacter sp. UBA4863 TaxID=1947060 RepID=UPI0025DC173D|nr:porin family protein [Pedobacter sp. UBA4863]